MKKYKLFIFFIYFVLLFSFGPALPPRALATNNYIDNISWTKDVNGEAIMTFHVLVSFDLTVGTRYDQTYNSYICYEWGNYSLGLNQADNYFNVIPVSIVGNHYVSLASCDTTFHYLAGNTYTNFMMSGTGIRYDRTDGYLCSSFLTNCGGSGGWNGCWSYITAVDGALTSDDYIDTFGKSLWAGNQWPMSDTEKYYFSEYPTLTITFPEDDAEIAGDFDITGTITMPSPYEYDQIFAKFFWYNPNDPANEFDFVQGYMEELIATSTQTFSIPIWNLPKSDPRYLGIAFSLIGGGGYSFTGSNIKIKTMFEIGTWPPGSPEFGDLYYLNTGLIDIWSPSPDPDGIYYLTFPTSSVDFMLYGDLAPHDLILITETTQGSTEIKLATTTLDNVLGGGYFQDIMKWFTGGKNGIFTLDNIDAETSTTSVLNAYIYSADGGLLVENHWFIKAVAEGGSQNVGIWDAIDTFITGQLTKVFSISEETKQLWFSLGDSLKAKIPFCYFYQVKDIFDNVDLEAAEANPFAMSVSFAGATTTFNILSTTHFESIANGAFISGLREIIALALWGLFMFWIFTLGRDFLGVHTE
jgi:hypothetical protein